MNGNVTMTREKLYDNIFLIMIIAPPKHGRFQALKACIAIIGPSDPLQVARAIEERKVTVAGLVSKPWAWVLG